MGFALFISSFLPSNPRSSVLFLTKLKNNFLVLFSNKNSYSRLVSTPLSAMKQISKGVYAKEDKELGTVYIKVTKDVEQTAQIIELNGKKIKIIYLK